MAWALCVFANLTYASAGKLNNMVLDTLLQLSKIQPRKLPPSNILTQRRDELVKLLPDWNNPQATRIFADNFFLDYFPDKLKAEATPIFAKAGKIVSIEEVVPENNLRGYFMLIGEKAKIKVSFTLTPGEPAISTGVSYCVS